MKHAIGAAHHQKTELTKKIIPGAFILMWSSGAIFVELGLRYADPFIFLFLRLLLSAFIFWGVVLYMKTELPATWREWGYVLFTGICMQAGYQIFYFLALDNHLSPGVLAILLGAQPIITAIASKNHRQPLQWIGLFFGIIGLMLVVADSILISTVTIAGLASALLSLFSITIGTLLQKNIQISQPSNLAIQYGGAALLLFLLVLLFDQSLNWAPLFAVSLGWMVLVISAGATFMFYHMVQKGDLTNVTSLLYAVPPVTAVFDYLIFGHRLEMISILGMMLIIIGLFLVNKEGRLV
ncbi:DMT family transporter [Pseudobacillus badius]|uniref:DMT family transporter n=1 Tax=Bacillus badius TaxID=1455 RepID=UPI0007B46853|nr:DMT family transporter [Bacillus badius]KZN99263.1 hypothetical protein A4244_19290 [Bacillus badius]TDV99744.1 drug/metabolite transporter (DMT)-like permease [Bacillus badius]UAT32880.1 DMT family transporter [Bacillus badius]GLY11821.1 hypothetical protein Bbad01_30370 [Bacillus badius]